MSKKARIEIVKETRDVFENGVLVDQQILSRKIVLHEGDEEREITEAEYDNLIAQAFS
jgi:hypothetical protein